MSGVTIEVNSSEVVKLAEDIAGRIDRKLEAMSTIGSLARESIRKNFSEGGRPGKWKALKYRSGQPLRDTGRLMNSIGKEVSRDRVLIGTNVVYAAIHNFGGKAGRGRKVTIPQREFMLLQDEDVTDIKKLLEEYILEGKL